MFRIQQKQFLSQVLHCQRLQYEVTRKKKEYKNRLVVLYKMRNLPKHITIIIESYINITKLAMESLKLLRMLCPISGNLMVDPVLAIDGMHYDKNSIEKDELNSDNLSLRLEIDSFVHDQESRLLSGENVPDIQISWEKINDWKKRNRRYNFMKYGSSGAPLRRK